MNFFKAFWGVTWHPLDDLTRNDPVVVMWNTFQRNSLWRDNICQCITQNGEAVYPANTNRLLLQHFTYVVTTLKFGHLKTCQSYFQVIFPKRITRTSLHSVLWNTLSQGDNMESLKHFSNIWNNIPHRYYQNFNKTPK